MLQLTTNIKALEFVIDDKVYKLPVTPTAADLKRMGVTVMDDDVSAEEAIAWFTTFASHYVPPIENLPIGELSKLMNAWSELQKENNEATMGES